MSATHASCADDHEPQRYEIRLKGHFDVRWANWFAGMTITALNNGETLLSGPVVDQAALHGVLKKVCDLGIPLLSVMRVARERADVPNVPTIEPR